MDSPTTSYMSLHMDAHKHVHTRMHTYHTRTYRSLQDNTVQNGGCQVIAVIIRPHPQPLAMSASPDRPLQVITEQPPVH